MRIIQCTSTEEAVKTVSGIILEKLEAHPETVLGLATGRTMEPVYKALAEKASAQTFSKTSFFMLDEYKGLPENHASSFKFYIKKHFILPLKLSDEQFSFPPAGRLEGPALYEKMIQDKGGVDLQLLGIGVNGHVGFNEPGSENTSRTRFVRLTKETLEANKDQFVDHLIPSEALSMGIGTILDSKELLLLATGKSKAEIIKYVLNHHDDPSCPATYLKNHPNLTIVLDPDAASHINLKI